MSDEMNFRYYKDHEMFDFKTATISSFKVFRRVKVIKFLISNKHLMSLTESFIPFPLLSQV